MTRFLHTSDWQLGMTRHFLREGAQEMFAQARIDAIRKLGEVAMEKVHGPFLPDRGHRNPPK